jgi:hypothetical protein
MLGSWKRDIGSTVTNGPAGWSSMKKRKKKNFSLSFFCQPFFNLNSAKRWEFTP